MVDLDSPIGGGGPIGADGPIGAGPPDNTVTLDKWQVLSSRAARVRLAPRAQGVIFVPPTAALTAPIRLGPGFIAYVPFGAKSLHERRRDWQRRDREHLRKTIALALEGDPGPLARLTGILVARDEMRAGDTRALLRLLAEPGESGLETTAAPELSPELKAALKEIVFFVAEEDDSEALLLAIA